jgi:hypothetical protein
MTNAWTCPSGVAIAARGAPGTIAGSSTGGAGGTGGNASAPANTEGGGGGAAGYGAIVNGTLTNSFTSLRWLGPGDWV